jgi:hypothetical protein
MDRWACRQAFQFCAQVFLHGLALERSASGQFVADLSGDVANGDLDCHAGILLLLASICNQYKLQLQVSTATTITIAQVAATIGQRTSVRGMELSLTW